MRHLGDGLTVVRAALVAALLVAGAFLVLAAASATPAPAQQSGTEIAASYEASERVSQTFYQNSSGGAWGQSTPARFTVALPYSSATVSSVSAYLTVVPPAGYLPVASVIQSPTVLYNGTVGYVVQLPGVQAGAVAVVESTVNLTNASGRGPPVGTYPLALTLSLVETFAQTEPAVWTRAVNDSYSITVALLAPSAGTLNFTSYAGGSGVTVPFPVPVNFTAGVQVCLGAPSWCLKRWWGTPSNLSDFQYSTGGSVTVVPPNLAASHGENLTVFVVAAPVSSGAIPVLTFDKYTVGGAYDYATLTYYNNQTYAYDGFFLIEYAVPYPLVLLNVSLLPSARAIPASHLVVSAGVITLLPGSASVGPGAVQGFEVRFLLLNQPPSISVPAGAVLGTFGTATVTLGELTLLLALAAAVYTVLVFVSWESAGLRRNLGLPDARSLRLRGVEAALATFGFVGLYLLELHG